MLSAIAENRCVCMQEGEGERWRGTWNVWSESFLPTYYTVRLYKINVDGGGGGTRTRLWRVSQRRDSQIVIILVHKSLNAISLAS